MILTVRGLAPLSGGDYYTLALAKRGKPVVTCGTFNVADRTQRTLHMSAAYDLKSFDGWVVTRWDAKTHQRHAGALDYARLRRDSPGGDERLVGHGHPIGEEVLARLRVATNLPLRGLGVA